MLVKQATIQGGGGGGGVGVVGVVGRSQMIAHFAIATLFFSFSVPCHSLVFHHQPLPPLSLPPLLPESTPSNLQTM